MICDVCVPIASSRTLHRMELILFDYKNFRFMILQSFLGHVNKFRVHSHSTRHRGTPFYRDMITQGIRSRAAAASCLLRRGVGNSLLLFFRLQFLYRVTSSHEPLIIIINEQQRRRLCTILNAGAERTYRRRRGCGRVERRNQTDLLCVVFGYETRYR